MKEGVSGQWAISASLCCELTWLAMFPMEYSVVLFTACGAVPSPFDCYMVNRGVKTLHLRMREHMKNGLAVAKALEANPRVTKVIHPGE